VDECLLKTVANALSSSCQTSRRRVFECELDEGRVIAIRDEDPAPLDPKAVGRHPYIIRAAVLSTNATPEDVEDVRRQLSGLCVPDKPGPADLQVYVFHPPEVPLVPLKGPVFAGFAHKLLAAYGLWLLVGVMGTVEVLLIIFSVEFSIAGTLVRLGFLIFLVGSFSWIRKPWPRQQDLGKLEWQWYDRARLKQRDFGFAARGARIIRADGSSCELSLPTPIRELGIARDPDSAVTYDARSHVRPGLLVLSGKERLINNGVYLSVAFSRTYVWRWAPWPLRGKWYLDLAQWTLLESRPATTVGRDVERQASDRR
jgi:hypothetical protein